MIKSKENERKAVRDCLIVKGIEKQFDMRSGLVLPSKMKTSLSEVVAVGELITTVKVGDKVLHDNYCCKELTDELKCLRYADVLGVE